MRFDLDKALTSLGQTFSRDSKGDVSRTVAKTERQLKSLLDPVTKALKSNDITVYKSRAVITPGTDYDWERMEAFSSIEFWLEVSLASDWYEAPRPQDVAEEVGNILNAPCGAKRVRNLKDGTFVWQVVIDLGHYTSKFMVPNPIWDPYDY